MMGRNKAVLDTGKIFLKPKFVVSYSTDVIFKSVRHNIKFCVPLLMNVEEEFEFVKTVFGELFDIDDISTKEFEGLLVCWTTDGQVTTVECVGWQ